MKRIVLFAILSLFVTNAYSETEIVDGILWTYTVDDGYATVGAIDVATAGDIVIPNRLGGYNVKHIGDFAFSGCRDLTGVTIQDGVASIGYSAFSNCVGLTKVIVPESVEFIASYAFAGCVGLHEMVLPFVGNRRCDGTPDDSHEGMELVFGALFSYQGGDGLTSVSQYVGRGTHRTSYIPSNLRKVTITDERFLWHGAFDGCSMLTEVSLPQGIEVIGVRAFYGCANLTSIKIPGSVTSIGLSAFNGCSGLTSISLGKNLVGIEDSTFANCTALESISIPDSVTSIGANAFSGCNDAIYDKITIPGVVLVDGWAIGNDVMLSGELELTGVRGIGDRAFYCCNRLTSVTIPDGVISVGDSAFLGCPSLTNVFISSSVTKIGDSVFSNCGALSSISVGSENAAYSSINGLLMSKDGGTLIQGINGDVVVPDGVESIADAAFIGRYGLKSVAVPSSVTNIGLTAFDGCYALQSFFVDNGNLAFSSMNGLLLSKSGEILLKGVNGIVDIPDGVLKIEPHAFDSLYELVSVSMPDSLKDIGYGAFIGCHSLDHVRIPNSVTNIGNAAFFICDRLTYLTIGSSVASIGAQAFQRCNALESIKIPESVTSIGFSAFAMCNNLSSITFEGNAPEIEEYAFDGLPSSCALYVSRESTGWGCDIPGMWQGIPIYYEPWFIVDNGVLLGVDLSNNKEVVIPEGITSIGTNAFAGCCDLVSVVIPDGVIDIGDFAFDRCINLQNVTIPDSVASIGACAFQDCRSLISVRMGDAVTKIGSSAFMGCSSVTNILISNNTRIIDKEAFSGCGNLASVTIPATVTRIGDYAFMDCASLKSVVFEGDAPDSGQDIYVGTPRTLVTCVGAQSIGWSGGISSELPEEWNGRAIVVSHGGGSGGTEGNAFNGNVLYLTTTNVVIHYVTTSVPSESIFPAETTGIVNVIAEVGSGGVVAIAPAWAEQYDCFEAKFGSDFTAAIIKPTGKYDGAGNPMYVWQDFVAGTDPTKEDDVFKASITFDKVTGNPVISWTPELTEAEAAKRNYKRYGKARLTDKAWSLINGDEAEYNFFKVTVEMK